MIAEIEQYVDKIQKKVFISDTTPHYIVNANIELDVNKDL